MSISIESHLYIRIASTTILKNETLCITRLICLSQWERGIKERNNTAWSISGGLRRIRYVRVFRNVIASTASSSGVFRSEYNY